MFWILNSFSPTKPGARQNYECNESTDPNKCPEESLTALAPRPLKDSPPSLSGRIRNELRTQGVSLASPLVPATALSVGRPLLSQAKARRPTSITKLPPLRERYRFSLRKTLFAPTPEELNKEPPASLTSRPEEYIPLAKSETERQRDRRNRHDNSGNPGQCGRLKKGDQDPR